MYDFNINKEKQSMAIGDDPDCSCLKKLATVSVKFAKTVSGSQNQNLRIRSPSWI